MPYNGHLTMRAAGKRRAGAGWVSSTTNITKSINVLMVRGGGAVRMGAPGARLPGWSGALRGARGPAAGGRLRGLHAWTERNVYFFVTERLLGSVKDAILSTRRKQKIKVKSDECGRMCEGRKQEHVRGKGRKQQHVRREEAAACANGGR